MQGEAEQSVVVTGASTVAAFASGRTFALQGHFNGDGSYLLTETDVATQRREARPAASSTRTRSRASPTALPSGRSGRRRSPCVGGSQTAIVVGPAGEEIFTDKYGRVKVQFHWDREGKKDEQELLLDPCRRSRSAAADTGSSGSPR